MDDNDISVLRGGCIRSLRVGSLFTPFWFLQSYRRGFWHVAFKNGIDDALMLGGFPKLQSSVPMP